MVTPMCVTSLSVEQDKMLPGPFYDVTRNLNELPNARRSPDSAWRVCASIMAHQVSINQKSLWQLRAPLSPAHHYDCHKHRLKLIRCDYDLNYHHLTVGHHFPCDQHANQDQ